MTYRSRAVVLALIAIFALTTVELLRTGLDLSEAAAQTIRFLARGALDPSIKFGPIHAFLLIGSAIFVGYAFAMGIAMVGRSVKRDIDGSGVYSHAWWRPKVAIVDPVDWEKVVSLVIEVRERLGNVKIVVIAQEIEGHLPLDLFHDNVRFVRGSLREQATYVRAGVMNSITAVICASSYNNPDQADARCAAIARLIESMKPNIYSSAEMVSRDNEDLFRGQHRGKDVEVDSLVCFDELTLAGVVSKLVDVLRGDDGEVVVRELKANTFDEFQQKELDVQLSRAGIRIDPENLSAPSVNLVLPVDLDDPTRSDFEGTALEQRSTGDVTLVLYLSVQSDDLFDPATSVCADRIMAEALVAEAEAALATV